MKKASGITKAMTFSDEFGELLDHVKNDKTIDSAMRKDISKGQISRAGAIKALWIYIKANDCQDSKDKRQINPDEVLAPIIGKKSISMMQLAKYISKHLSEIE